MATEIAKAYVQLVPSASGFKSSIKSQIGSDVTSAGTEAGTSFGSSMVSSLKAIILAAGLGTIIKEAFDVGAALEQNIGGVETLYKESSDTMLEYAQQAYETAGISANDYLEQSTSFAAALLSSLDGDTAAAAESANQAIIDMADNSNKMGTALESIQNAYAGFAKQNYTINNLMSAA
jgi:ABC-type transporter Mla subunit MlaD